MRMNPLAYSEKEEKMRYIPYETLYIFVVGLLCSGEIDII
jgi:hypothetical protein